MYKKLMIAAFTVILAGLSLSSLIFMPKEEHPFSENENRYLASFPKLSVGNLKDKSFMKGFDAWTSDMFPGREYWISFKNYAERASGKLEINGVYTYGGRIMQSWTEDFSAEITDKNLDAINSFAERHNEVPMFFMPVPTSQEIYKDTLPPAAVAGDQLKYIGYCKEYLTNLTTINVADILAENRNRYIYYRTDHHWTCFGAYLGYLQAARIMGFGGLDIGRFKVERVSHDFRGTLYSKTLDKRITPDIIDYYILTEGDPETTVSVLESDKYTDYPSLYFREYLDKKDKYASFLGQNTPILKVKTKLDGNNSKLLIFKDSYAHCLIPFLSKNYSEITVCDMRYINLDYKNYINVEEYDQVLFVFNVVTFSEDTNIRKLNLGKGYTA